MGKAWVPTPAGYPAFFFVLEKAVKSAGNAVILTFPAHCPHGLQHLRHKRPTFAFAGESEYTLGFAQRIAHNGSHAETRGVSDGGGITALGPFRTFTNIPGPGIRTAYFAALGGLVGGAPKERREPRDSDALMRVAVPRRRGPAGLRDLFASAEVAACTPCAQCFPNVRDEGWYHYPQRALRAAETPDGRLSKGLICHFSRSGGLH